MLIKDNICLRKKLINIVKLMAYPEQAEECVCMNCHIPYTDTVEHYIMRCEYFNNVRNEFWDNVLDHVECKIEATLLQKDQDNMLDILLTKESNLFEFYGETHRQCICLVSKNIDSLMYVV